jgi:hypothetical protein
MSERIAVETMTLIEVSELFKRSLEIARPRARVAIAAKVRRLNKEKVSSHKWTKTYEIVKHAKINFYCEKTAGLIQPIVSIGMIHRTINGLILMAVDRSNGGFVNEMNYAWKHWVIVYTAHYCERFAERIMKIELPTFTIGANAIMFSDLAGIARVTDKISDDLEEIAFQFKDGQAFGYRDNKSKIIYWKTVYSNEMLHGDRLKFKDDWEESINQLNEIFKSK